MRCHGFLNQSNINQNSYYESYETFKYKIVEIGAVLVRTSMHKMSFIVTYIRNAFTAL